LGDLAGRGRADPAQPGARPDEYDRRLTPPSRPNPPHAARFALGGICMPCMGSATQRDAGYERERPCMGGSERQGQHQAAGATTAPSGSRRAALLCLVGPLQPFGLGDRDTRPQPVSFRRRLYCYA
jgi:hypothetical protein